MTAAKLQDKRVRDLARMAKQSGVPGWHAMRKDELIIALTCRATKAIDKARNLTVRGTDDAKKLPIATEQPSASLQEDHHSIKNQLRPARKVRVGNPVDRKVVIQRVRDLQAQQSQEKSLATKQEPKLKHHTKRNRLVVLVRGPHWLHAFWEITESTIKRVQASMREQWHTAKPILRLLDSPENKEESAVERVIREIEIHGGVKNWFIDLRQPMSCRVKLGISPDVVIFIDYAKAIMFQLLRPIAKTLSAFIGKTLIQTFRKSFHSVEAIRKTMKRKKSEIFSKSISGDHSCLQNPASRHLITHMPERA